MDWLVSSFRSNGSKDKSGESKLKRSSNKRSETSDGLKRPSNTPSTGGDDETFSVSSFTSSASHVPRKWAWHNHLPMNGPLTLQAYKARLTTSEGTQTIHLPGANYNIRYAFVSQRGFYPDTPNKLNQDQFTALPAFGGDPDRAFFGVFDGHGEFGTEAAQFARDRVPLNMIAQLNSGAPVDEAYHRAMVLANMQLHRLPGVDDVMSGTTAITALISGKMLHVANVGDSRCVLAERRGDKVIARDMSIDHTPFRKDECRRVKAKGARVLTLAQVEGVKPKVETDDWGKEEENDGDPPRLWAQDAHYPGTAFSRSIGDALAEKIGVIADPEVMSIDLTTSSQHPYLILASDGVWEFLSSQEVVDLVGRHEDPQEACLSLVADSYRQWLLRETRTDDITAIVIQFQGLRKQKPLPPLPPPAPSPTPGLVAHQEPISISIPAQEDSSSSFFQPSTLYAKSVPNIQRMLQHHAPFSPLPPPASSSKDVNFMSMAQQLMKEHLSQLLASPSDAPPSPSSSSPTSASPGPITLHQPSTSLLSFSTQEPPSPSPDEFAFLSRALRGNFLFAGLGAEKQKEVFSLFERRQVSKGDVILRQGERGNFFFVVESGEFDVILKPPGSATSHLVHTYLSVLPNGPIASFGDLALLHADKPRAATVVAQTSGMVWSLHREPFQKLVRSPPSCDAGNETLDGAPTVTLDEVEAALKALKETEVFESLTSRQLRSLVSAMQLLDKGAGECIVKQGESIKDFFLILSGELTCLVESGSESKEVLRLGPGQHFGERALSGRGAKKVAAKSSIVVASERSRLLKLNSKSLEGALGVNMGDLSAAFDWWITLMDAQAVVVTRKNATVAKLLASDPPLVPFSSLETRGILFSLDSSALMFMEWKPQKGEEIPKQQKTEVVVVARLTSIMDATASEHQDLVLTAREITRSLEPSLFIPYPIKSYKDDKLLAEILSSPLPLCTLESILSSSSPFDEESAAFVAAGVALGLEQLHRSGVIYRGLSSDTVAVTEGGLAQLLNFRYARRDDGRAFTLCSSRLEFLAPEIILGRSPSEVESETETQAEAVDVWALGVLICSMLSGGQTPFSSPGDDDLRVYRKIVCSPPNLPSQVSAQARDLVMAMLQKEPSKRLGRPLGLVEALRAHPWFKDFDWMALAEQRLPTPPGLRVKLDAFEGVEWAEFLPSPCPSEHAGWIKEF